MEIKLTEYSKGSGCGCKIAPGILSSILSGLEQADNKSHPLLVSFNTRDDAAVIRLNDKQNLINTVDFFTPIVDDPVLFGKIAAVNAINDVFAMGGKPITALSILGWPVEKLPVSLCQQVLSGAVEVCKSQGISLAGGHSINSAEPFFGLNVVGIQDVESLKTNSGANPGDLIYLTKPLGSGVLGAAHKRGMLADAHYSKWINYMLEINDIGFELGRLKQVSSLTDVTGFGFLGHLLEILEASNCSANINYNALPIMEGVEPLLKQFVYPDNTTKNYTAYSEKLKTKGDLDFLLLCDPQTSGGLIITVPPDFQKEFEQFYINKKQKKISPIGLIIDKNEGKSLVEIHRI